MSTYISREVQEGLDAARKAAMRTRSRLRVQAGRESWPVLRMWDEGLSLDADTAPMLRGLVDVYDGSRHLWQALIVASDSDGQEIICEFKRATQVADTPPVDFERDEMAPAGLIAHG